VSVVDDIFAERKWGVVHCGVSVLGHTDTLQLAKEFGLGNDPASFEEIAASDAIRLVTSILHKDMAYSQPCMSENRAKELAVQFFAQFGSQARYFSNGWPGGWNPATDATFDTGVLVTGDRSGCLWVEDED
jgi:hypothetical protein